MPGLEAVDMEEAVGRQLEVSMLCDWLGVHICLSGVGPNLEA